MSFKKKIFFLFFFFSTNIFALEVENIVSINNKIITNIDLDNEIEIIKIINKNKNLEENYLNKLAISNLVNDEIKLLEVKKEKITIEEKNLNNYLNVFFKNLEINEKQIKKKYVNLIKKKIKIDLGWKQIIDKEYKWKININMMEINKKIYEQNKGMNSTNTETIKILKENMIRNEKEKKLLVYENFHLNKKKKIYLIKYYK